jgi:hypothetical protein
MNLHTHVPWILQFGYPELSKRKNLANWHLSGRSGVLQYNPLFKVHDIRCKSNVRIRNIPAYTSKGPIPKKMDESF